MKQEVEKWRPFGHPDGDIRDLSFLDAHQAVYVQHHEGKEPLEYRFWVTYSLHCFTKDYEHQTNGNDSNLLIVFYVQIMPDDFVMQLHRF
ncbi:heat shock protein C [Escherichia coli]|nr:heat shock protein C [Escherichia coli]